MLPLHTNMCFIMDTFGKCFVAVVTSIRQLTVLDLSIVIMVYANFMRSLSKGRHLNRHFLFVCSHLSQAKPVCSFCPAKTEENRPFPLRG